MGTISNFYIFVMLINTIHHETKSFSHLKYTSRTVVTSPLDGVNKPSVRAGFCIMETFDLFNQPNIPVKNRLTQDFVKSIFTYEDGFLYWKKRKQGMKPLDIPAGYVNHNDYSVIMVNRRNYYLHRLIFLFHCGYMPDFIDHIDTNRRNNNIENLREATNIQNSYNKRKQKGLTSQYKGVYLSQGKYWQSSIMYNGKRIYLGLFATEKDAALAYNDAAKIHHGQFANLNIIIP
jgi:HNH endonuclease